MGSDLKYGRITTERNGNTGPIPDDEPVMLFRAQDKFSLQVLMKYLELCSRDEQVVEEHVDGIGSAIERFRAWRSVNPNKVRTPGRVR